MLQILNTTPFASGLALLCDSTGADVVSVVVKGTFAIPSRGTEAPVADEQQPVLYAAQHYGDPDSSSIKYPADIVLGKVGTDIGLIGSAHAPGDKPVQKLPVSLSVGRFRKVIYVIGDRQWKPHLVPGVLAMSAPKPFVKMPLVHERAFGGKYEDQKKRSVVNFPNPVGAGFWPDRRSAEGRPLPNLEDPAHLIDSWKDRPPVACYGFVDGWWEPRRRFAGSYGDEWRKEHFPVLPRDFDLRFCNAGQEGLVADGFLEGGEPVEFVNLSQRGHIRFAPDADRFCMVWGASFRIGKQPSRMKCVRVEIEEGALVAAPTSPLATSPAKQLAARR